MLRLFATLSKFNITDITEVFAHLWQGDNEKLCKILRK